MMRSPMNYCGPKSPRVGLVAKSSSYPESERLYFQRKYGSDVYDQRRDRRQVEALHKYCLVNKRKELKHVISRVMNLSCENVPGLAPGRSAIILSQLRDNLALFEEPSHQSLRWNEHYRQALEMTCDDLVREVKVMNHGMLLKPVSLQAVAESESFVHNANKHAGYIAFESGKRSKRDNVEQGIKWCEEHEEAILLKGNYGLPQVLGHRSSNSKVSSWESGTFKARCRAINMADVRQQLMDGRFQVPFNCKCLNVAWSEGGMSHEDVQSWINVARSKFNYYYSSDYSKFDTSQSDWLLEDAFKKVIRPCFDLNEHDDKLFDVMVKSYIVKDIHGFDRIYHAKKGNTSGSLWTYWINTIINEIVDRTAILMQGFDPRKVISLKCGDDNVVFHNFSDFDPRTHARLIQRFFGIKTTIGDNDFGTTAEAPLFLSRVWGYGGAERPIYEVVWNLIHPERFRDYYASGIPISQAVALVLYCAVIEQPATMRKYFDVKAIQRDAKVDSKKPESAYRMLAKAGSGFYTGWINMHLGLGAQPRRKVA